MGERLTVVLNDGAGEKLQELAGGSRRQGEFISKMIEAAWEGQHSMNGDELNVETLRLQLMGMAGQVKSHEGRILQLEHQVAAMMAAGAAAKVKALAT